jgi:hypothetical protein
MREHDAPRIEKTATQARAGVTGHNVRYVLIGGLTAIILAFGILLIVMFK